MMTMFIAAIAAHLLHTQPKSRVNKIRPFGIVGGKEQDIYT